MTVNVPVSAYVYDYLLSTQGPGPYDLSVKARNNLRLSFFHFGVTADFWPQPISLPGYYVTLDFGEDSELSQAYQALLSLLKTGAFYQAEFMQALRQYVAAQESLAKRWGLSKKVWTKGKAIDSFLEDHKIRPNSYDFYAAYRQLNRLEQAEKKLFSEKLCQKLGLCARGDYPYKLCYLYYGKNQKYIAFWAYSASAKKLIRKRHRIPKKVLLGRDWLGYVREAMNIINQNLMRGGYLK